MHALELDFQTTRRRVHWQNLLLLLAGISAGGALGYQYLASRNTIEMLDARRVMLERITHYNARVQHLTPEQARSLRAEVKDAKSVLSQLRLPWGPLLSDIGGALTGQVALLAIVPDVPRRTIKISGEAKDLNAVLSYIESLQKAKSLGSVYLQNHQIVTGSAQRPVRFTLLAKWEMQK